MQILVTDENEAFARGLRNSLQREEHRIVIAPDSSSLPPLLTRHTPHLIIVDKDLLEIDGLRPFVGLGEDTHMPLVLLVAHAEEEKTGEEELLSERISAFKLSHLRRAEALLRGLRRLLEEGASVLEIGQLSINFDRKQATFCGKPLPLTPIQFRLVVSLALDTGRVVGFRELLENVWGYQGEEGEARELLKVHINRIRHKVRGLAEGGDSYIQSVRGFGYMLTPPDE
jgi:two-component system KDP operon response regulator KdpE